MKTLIPLVLLLFFSCKKTADLSGKIEISVKTHASVTIKNGTNNSVDLIHWKLKEDIVGILHDTINYFLFTESTVLQKGQSNTYSASELGFSLDLLSTISLYDSSGFLIATN
jgi:hypothetical protein